MLTPSGSPPLLPVQFVEHSSQPRPFVLRQTSSVNEVSDQRGRLTGEQPVEQALAFRLHVRVPLEDRLIGAPARPGLRRSTALPSPGARPPISGSRRRQPPQAGVKDVSERRWFECGNDDQSRRVGIGDRRHLARSELRLQFCPSSRTSPASADRFLQPGGVNRPTGTRAQGLFAQCSHVIGESADYIRRRPRIGAGRMSFLFSEPHGRAA